MTVSTRYGPIVRHWSFGFTATEIGCIVGCFTSTETVGLLGTVAQDGHLDFHTARCNVVAIDRFYIALFSALEQTHCACM